MKMFHALLYCGLLLSSWHTSAIEHSAYELKAYKKNAYLAVNTQASHQSPSLASQRKHLQAAIEAGEVPLVRQLLADGVPADMRLS